MRLEERCSCGGQITVIYDVNKHSYRPDECAEAHEQLDVFRLAHARCLPTFGREAQTAGQGLMRAFPMQR